MAKRSPYEGVFEVITNFLSVIADKKGMVDQVPPEMLEQVKILAEHVKQLDEAAQEQLKEAGVDPDTPPSHAELVQKLSPRELKFIDQLKKLELELRSNQMVLKNILDTGLPDAGYARQLAKDQADRESGKAPTDGEKAAKKRTIRKRRKKFRRLGGDGWTSV